MAFHRKKREEVRVDLTSMIDVVFLLLIFFMISTTFVETPGLSIKLPESSAQRAAEEPRELRIYVSSKGEIYLKDQKIDVERLRKELRSNRDRSAETTFLLLADQEARHGRVVELMDLAREEGFTRLAIATEPRRKE